MLLAARILVVSALVAAFAIGYFAPIVGGSSDDGIYLATAQSLAEGRGYRIASLPDEQPQTKYPFLFPALLAAVWRMFPSFPANVPALKLVPLAAAFLWAGAVFLVFRKCLGSNGAVWLSLLVLAMPWTVFLGTTLLAETVFASLTWLALWRLEEADATGSIGAFAGGILLASAAFLARTTGAALLLTGFLVALLQIRVNPWKRDWKPLAAFAAICGPWLLWQAVHPAPANAVLAYYSKANYAQWNLAGNFAFNQTLKILGTNIFVAVLSVASLLGLPNHPAAMVLSLLLSSLAAIGWLIEWRRSRALALWSAVYSLLIMAWAWPPERFLVILAPALLYYMWIGAQRVLPSVEPVRLATAAVAMILLMCGIGLFRQASATLRQGTAAGPQEGLEVASTMDSRIAIRLLADFGAEHPGNVILAGMSDPLYYLYSRKKALRPFAIDPFQLYYSDESTRQPLGDSAALTSALAANRADFLVVEGTPPGAEFKWFRKIVLDAANRHPEWLTLEKQDPAGQFRIYRIHGDRIHPASDSLSTSAGLASE